MDINWMNDQVEGPPTQISPKKQSDMKPENFNEAAEGGSSSHDLLSVGNRPEDYLDEEHPQWCANEQIKDLLLGFGANEDSRMVIEFFQEAGLPKGTAERIHHAIVGAERSPLNDLAQTRRAGD